MTHAEKITRRQFGRMAAGAAAVTAAELAMPRISAAQQGPNLFDVLSQYQFKDQKGDDVTVSGDKVLKKELENSYVTVNFGLNNCTSKYCEKIDHSLQEIHRLAGPKTKLKHIIVDVDPEHDNASKESRKEYLAMLSSMSGLKEEDLIVLYPKDVSKMPEMSNRLKLTAALDDPKSHSAEIGLFGPGGGFIAKKNSQPWNKKVDMFDDWGPLLR